MTYSNYKISILGLLILFSSCQTRPGQTQTMTNKPPQIIDIEDIDCGAERTALYFSQLKGKSIGLVCNQTSLVNGVHLADALIHAGFNIKTIFSPEHGFRGDTEAGAGITDAIDQKTGARIVSLYGSKKKPLPADLAGIDILIFDIQDVGVRFYTYISTLSLVMEAAAAQDIPVIVTDRPNPNGFYIDGPVLDTAFRSFVGMHPVPVVYGMTIGEYASMINGERWIGDDTCQLTVIPMTGYDHRMIVRLKEKPSPNLPTWQSVYLYPSLCLFEGTIMSVGRGTDNPFQVIGHPGYLIGSYAFKPKSIPGVAEHPPFENKECFGMNVVSYADDYQEHKHPFNISWLILTHDIFKDSTNFFNAYFDKLAGSDRLRKDILLGKTEQEIRNGWEADLNNFRLIRKKYLLYPE